MVNEQKLREKINHMGYKLKSDNGRCFHIKGYPESTSFKTLEEVEKWVNDRIAKEQAERNQYYEKMKLLDAKVKFPTYTEKCKEAFFDSIKKHGIKDSKDYLYKLFDENNEIYMPDSEYGVCINSYDVEGILENINYNECSNSFDHCLRAVIDSDMEDFYYEEIIRLNPDIDTEIICDLPSYEPSQLYNDAIDHITVEELKDFIYGLIENEAKEERDL